MDPSNLVASVTLSTAGWLYGGDKRDKYQQANEAHRDLLAIVRRWQNPGKGQSRLPEALRNELIAATNRWSRAAIDLTHSALEVVAHSGAAYLDDSPDWDDEVDLGPMPFTSLPPELHGIRASFKALPHLRRLLPAQQAAVTRSIDLDIDLSSASISLQYAIEGGVESDTAELRAEVNDLESESRRASAQLGSQARSFKGEFIEEAADLMHHFFLKVLEVPWNAGPKVMHDLAQGLQEAGQTLIQPFALHPQNSRRSSKAARLAWRDVEDAGALLRALAIWLRAMAEAPPGMKCPLCYRYRQQGSRRFCSEHQRKSGERREARELHVARLLNLELERALADSPRVQSLVSQWTNPASATDSARGQARAYKVRSDLVPRAALLATTLTELRPVLEPGLCAIVSTHFGAMLTAAEQAFKPSDESGIDRFWRRVHINQAPEWLGWDTFVKSWFGEKLAPPWLAPPKQGLGFDVAHPAAKGESFAPTTVAMDLFQQRVWTQATERLDSEGYVSLNKVLKLRHGEKKGDSSTEGLTLAEIAKELEVSPETVRKTIKYTKESDGKPRRDRIPPKKMQRLFGDNK
jgi:hypothetical protein